MPSSKWMILTLTILMYLAVFSGLSRATWPADVTWDGRDSRGRAVSSGVYFYRMTTEGFQETRKMLLLK